MNMASEYGFGAVLAVLPGFIVIRDLLSTVPNPALPHVGQTNFLCRLWCCDSLGHE
jgi:hypothetical protein